MLKIIKKTPQKAAHTPSARPRASSGAVSMNSKGIAASAGVFAAIQPVTSPPTRDGINKRPGNETINSGAGFHYNIHAVPGVSIQIKKNAI